MVLNDIVEVLKALKHELEPDFFFTGYEALGPYAEISLVARSRSSLTTSLTTRTTSYSETALEVVLQVSLLVRLASLTS